MGISDKLSNLYNKGKDMFNNEVEYLEKKVNNEVEYLENKVSNEVEYIKNKVKNEVKYIGNQISATNTEENAANTSNQAVIPPRVLTPAESIAEWNASYDKLINQIANCKSMEERSELVSNHQEKLIDFKASNLPVENHLAYLCVTIEGQILPNKNGQLLTGEDAWKYNYDKLIDKVANCKSMEERRALVNNHQEELVRFKDSKLSVDNDLAFLRVTIRGQILPNTNGQFLTGDETGNQISVAGNAVGVSSVNELLSSGVPGMSKAEVDKGLGVMGIDPNTMQVKTPNDAASPQSFEQYQAQLMRDQGATQAQIDEQQIRNAELFNKNSSISKEETAEMLSLQVKYGTKAAIGYQIAKMAVKPSGLTIPERAVLGGAAFLAAAGTSAISSEAGAAVKDIVNNSGSTEKEKVANDWKENLFKNIAWSNVSIPGKNDMIEKTGKDIGGVLHSITKDGILKGFEEIKSRIHSDGNAHGETPPPTQEQQLNFRTNLDGNDLKPTVNSSDVAEVKQTQWQFKTYDVNSILDGSAVKSFANSTGTIELNQTQGQEKTQDIGTKSIEDLIRTSYTAPMEQSANTQGRGRSH